jgi:hypothetical protein
MRGLSGCCELLYGLDADDRRDAGRLELAPSVAEKRFDGCDVEPAAHLVRPRDREVLARGCEQAAALELVLEGFHLDFVGLERQVSSAERVGEGFVRKIVESIMMVGSLGHRFAPVAWVRAVADVFSIPTACLLLRINRIKCSHKPRISQLHLMR